MAIIRFILGILQWIIIVGISLLALYLLSANFNILGGYRPYVVQSGSMEPAIMTGDVIVIQSRGVYNINDVVTFTNNSGNIVTHRIVAVDRAATNTYSTKGDANRSGDEDAIGDSQIIGKVALVVPHLGYVVSFAKTPPGFLFLIIIPAIVFILDEMVKVKRYAKARN
jgi:signal peptidase I